MARNNKIKNNNRLNHKSTADFLVSSVDEMTARGWDYVDIVIINGDAYVDHPSFGAALIGRWLEKLGCRVAILAQPDWRSADAFHQFGPPRLFWGITSGAVDSRLNAYSSMGHKREKDVYSPGGRAGMRPDKPLPAYAARAREAYKGIPIILGGLEASLRRMVHYDYIEDKLKRSILIDTKADFLVYGMAEYTIAEIARRLEAGMDIEGLLDIPGLVYPLRKHRHIPEDAVDIPGFEEQGANNELVMMAHLTCQQHSHAKGKPLVQDQGAGVVVANPPAEPISSEDMDVLYALPFTRSAHPRYDKMGGVPALQTVQFSIVSHRGCFGGCSFCSLYFHQGKHISSRSIESLLQEADIFTNHRDFRGTIQDIGGPSANMYGMTCGHAVGCTRTSCIYPHLCQHLRKQYSGQLDMMEQFIRWSQQGGKKNVFIASGVRHDMALWNDDYIDLLVRHFVGGHLKVAPEHICHHILSLMGKPSFDLFLEFEDRFTGLSRRAGKEQYLVPYFISAHPGSSVNEAIELCQHFLERNWRLRQVQDFTPIPLTLSTAMYVSGRDPAGKRIHVARGRKEKKAQMALLKYHEPDSYNVIRDYLKSNQTNVSAANADSILGQIKRTTK